MPGLSGSKIALSLATFATLASGLLASVGAREQEYVADISDYALVSSIKSLFDGEPLAEGFGNTRSLSSIDIVKLLKTMDVEFDLRARPAWRADGDKLKHARGFYEVRLYLWDTVGPLAALDYRVQLSAIGSATKVRSQLTLNVRRFGPGEGILRLANVPLVHRLINRVAERAVQAAEWGIVNGYAAADRVRRDRERKTRREQ